MGPGGFGDPLEALWVRVVLVIHLEVLLVRWFGDLGGPMGPVVLVIHLEVLWVRVVLVVIIIMKRQWKNIILKIHHSMNIMFLQERNFIMKVEGKVEWKWKVGSEGSGSTTFRDQIMQIHRINQVKQSLGDLKGLVEMTV